MKFSIFKCTQTNQKSDWKWTKHKLKVDLKGVRDVYVVCIFVLLTKYWLSDGLRVIRKRTISRQTMQSRFWLFRLSHLFFVYLSSNEDGKQMSENVRTMDKTMPNFPFLSVILYCFCICLWQFAFDWLTLKIKTSKPMDELEETSKTHKLMIVKKIILSFKWVSQCFFPLKEDKILWFKLHRATKNSYWKTCVKNGIKAS